MRRPASEVNDEFDEKDDVTLKSMLISMVRVCVISSFDHALLYSFSSQLTDAFSLMEVDDMSSDRLDRLLRHTSVLY